MTKQEFVVKWIKGKLTYSQMRNSGLTAEELEEIYEKFPYWVGANDKIHPIQPYVVISDMLPDRSEDEANELFKDFEKTLTKKP